jgi:hypothetical protein
MRPTVTHHVEQERHASFPERHHLRDYAQAGVVDAQVDLIQTGTPQAAPRRRRKAGVFRMTSRFKGSAGAADKTGKIHELLQHRRHV